MPRIKARSNLWIDGQRIEADSFAELSEEQIHMLPKGFIYEMDEPGNTVHGVPESTVIDTPEAAEVATLDLLRPFLKVPEEEARVAIAELLHGGPAELPPAPDPILDRPLHSATTVSPPPGTEETGKRTRRPRGGQ